jgi:protein Mpv17
MEGLNASEIKAKFINVRAISLLVFLMKCKTFPTLITRTWQIWPFVQVINFKYVPLPYQSIVVGVVSLFWNTYISTVNNSASQIAHSGHTIEMEELEKEE